MSDKFDRDPEMDEMLRPLKNAQPKPADLARWQSAVRLETSWFRRELRSLPRLAAGLAMGFCIGAWYFHQQPPLEENIEPSATITYVFSKSE